MVRFVLRRGPFCPKRGPFCLVRLVHGPFCPSTLAITSKLTRCKSDRLRYVKERNFISTRAFVPILIFVSCVYVSIYVLISLNKICLNQE